MRYQWDAHGLPLELYGLLVDYFCDAHDLPMGCRWALAWIRMGYSWATDGVPMGCPWGTHGLPMGCPWHVHEMPVGWP